MKETWKIINTEVTTQQQKILNFRLDQNNKIINDLIIISKIFNKFVTNVVRDTNLDSNTNSKYY